MKGLMYTLAVTSFFNKNKMLSYVLGIVLAKMTFDKSGGRYTMGVTKSDELVIATLFLIASMKSKETTSKTYLMSAASFHFIDMFS